ncbi:MAG: golvesin C-terminal-like domain-containing protein, partial [Planctomycetota bacterium]
ATGSYRVDVSMQVVESGGTNGIREYQIGVIINGVHRSHPGYLAGATSSGAYGGLTSGYDDLGVKIVSTSQFPANAGDDLVISFGTDVTSGAWNGNSGLWGSTHAIVDDITLVPMEPITELIVESRAGGKNYSNYSSSGMANSSSKSNAPGTTPGIGSQYGSLNKDVAGVKWAQFSFTPEQSGLYDLSATWVRNWNTGLVEHIVTHDGGTDSILMDQNETTNPGSGHVWNPVGRYQLTVGNTYTVTLTNENYPGSAIFRADAIKWLLVVQLPMDIKPGLDPDDCPNLLTVNLQGKGRLPIAILGTEDVDVSEIVVESISIAGTVFPVRTPSVDDVSSPAAAECECNGGPDGIDDLVIHVSRRELILALSLDDLEPGAVVPVTVEGMLLGGRPFVATDCVTLLARGD